MESIDFFPRFAGHGPKLNRDSSGLCKRCVSHLLNLDVVDVPRHSRKGPGFPRG